MEYAKRNSTAHLITAELEENRRRDARVDCRFAVTFSGMDKGNIVMDEGHVFNLSRQGIGKHADHSLKPGMELALFVELPDLEDHLCIPEAHVAWVRGHCFGVALRTLRREDQDRLRHFLWTYPQQHRYARQNGARRGHTRKAC